MAIGLGRTRPTTRSGRSGAAADRADARPGAGRKRRRPSSRARRRAVSRSLALELVWPGRLTYANYYGTGGARGAETLHEAGGTATRTFEYDLFNVEQDEFPYADGTFDVVLFGELIEHLAINPVWALAEIHRVLRPDGILVLTTPNRVSLERLDYFLMAGSPAVDAYAPSFGYGARHNREYTPSELRELLEETGFAVETIVARDLGRYGLRRRLKRALRKRWLRRYGTEPRDEHVFVRARRRDVFRWRFPERLFQAREMIAIARHPFVEMGVNDTIQCGHGWEPVDPADDGVRRIRWRDEPMSDASVVSRATADWCAVAVRARGVAGDADGYTRARLSVKEHGIAERAIASQTLVVPVGSWVTVEVPLARSTVARELLGLSISVERGHELAVRRIALVNDGG